MYAARVKGLLTAVLASALAATACAGNTTPDLTTTTVAAATTTSSAAVSTTTAPPTTTMQVATTTLPPIDFPIVALPSAADCALDGVPNSGEATVLAAGRLYGLGADGMTPRCLIDGVTTGDFEWGPQGDRIRVGEQVILPNRSVALPPAQSYVWTAPTGSRVLAVNADRLWKFGIDDGAEIDITFLAQNDLAAYHPAGEHVLVIGSAAEAEQALWLATNQGADPLLLAFDEAATLSSPAWTWLGEPLFAADHSTGTWHIHRVELTADGALDGPIVLETDEPIDLLLPSKHDPIMLAYRLGGAPGQLCVEGAHVGVKATDVPEPVASMTSTPVGWLSTERLLIMTFPNGCDAPADLWTFSAGFCPGSVYGVTPLITGIEAAAARESSPPPPPPPDFTGVIDPGPA